MAGGGDPPATADLVCNETLEGGGASSAEQLAPNVLDDLACNETLEGGGASSAEQLAPNETTSEGGGPPPATGQMDLGEEAAILKDIENYFNTERVNARLNEISLKSLFRQQKRFGFGNLKTARLRVITTILQIRAVLRLNFETAYLAVLLFDRFMSRTAITNEKLPEKKLSLACLSLATKTEETSVFQKLQAYCDAEELRRKESMVWRTLGFRTTISTPFTFLPFFVQNWSKESNPAPSLWLKTIEITLAVMRDVNLMEHTPSAVAAAATLRALEENDQERLTREALQSKIDSLPSSRFQKTEEVFACYVVMQKLNTGNLNIPGISAIQVRATNDLEDSPTEDLGESSSSDDLILGQSSSSAGSGTKRKFDSVDSS